MVVCFGVVDRGNLVGIGSVDLYLHLWVNVNHIILYSNTKGIATKIHLLCTFSIVNFPYKCGVGRQRGHRTWNNMVRLTSLPSTTKCCTVELSLWSFMHSLSKVCCITSSQEWYTVCTILWNNYVGMWIFSYGFMTL